MIVLCPGCHTRYRHPPESGGTGPAPAEAHCGRCDEHFPLEVARRSYVLLPGGPVPRAAGVPAAAGMDDPWLGGQLRPAATDDPEPARRSAEPAEPAPAIGTGADAVAPEPDAAPPTGGRSAFVDLLLAVVPAGLGGGVAYYLAGRNQLDPVSITALGAAAGLLLGWACMQWTRRHD